MLAFIFGDAASLHIGLPVRLPAFLFLLASGEVLMIILASTKSEFDAVKSKFGLLLD